MTSIRHAIDRSSTTHATVDAQGAQCVAATRVAEHVCVSPGRAIKSACARSEIRLIHPRLSTQLVCQGLCLCARLCCLRGYAAPRLRGPAARRGALRLGAAARRGAARWRGGSQQMKQETLQNAARRCSAANTTAVCRGCFVGVGNRGTTPGIAHGLCAESWLRAGPKAKPEGDAPPKSRPILLTPLKRPTPTNTENSAQRTPSGGGTARNTTDERREGTADCTSRASSSSSRSQSPAGESNPPKAPAPGTFPNRAEVPGGQTDTKIGPL